MTWARAVINDSYFKTTRSRVATEEATIGHRHHQINKFCSYRKKYQPSSFPQTNIFCSVHYYTETS